MFHVANQAMITQVMAHIQKSESLRSCLNHFISDQPTGGDNLEVKEQGSTRVLLTASSNQIEVLFKFFRCCLQYLLKV